jgi:outer membrane protein OmpU
MKKQLLATTALVAAGLMVTATAQAKPKLAIGGWFEGIVGVVNDDRGEVNGAGAGHLGVDVQQDAEIHFKGSVTLDNGIKIRTRVELEGTSANSTDTIDEAYVDISGSFGAIRIGSEDNAAHLMVTPYQGHWATNVGQNISFDTGDWIEAPAGMGAGSVNRLDLGDADSEKISYFTPRIGGFQVGVSYLPSLTEGDNGEPESRAENPHEGFAAAANYNGKFSGVGVGLAAGYATIKPASPAVSVEASDPEGVAAGIRLDFGGLRVAYGYHREWNLSSEVAATDNGDTAHQFGVKYKAGKNHFSVGYRNIQDEGQRAVAAEDELNSVLVSYRRDLGPGVQYRLNFFWADYDGEAVGSGDDNEGIALTTSVRLAF